MKAVIFDPQDNFFKVREIAVPEPKKDEVLVKVLACGLNPVDAKIEHWKSNVLHMTSDWTVGLDVAGEIVALGADVKGWNIGDRVLYHGNMFEPHGGFAEFAIHKAESLLSHPNVSSVIAASTPCAGWTAWRALIDKLRVQEQHSLLIMGASGGVGSFAIQVAKAKGVSKIIACCSSKNHEYVLGLGATHALDYQDEDWLQKIYNITDGQGVDRAVDCVGREHDVAISNSLSFEGEMVSLVTSLRTESYKDIFMRGLSFHQFSLGAAHGNGTKGVEKLLEAGKNFSILLEKGMISVPVLQEISLEEVGEALFNMKQRKTLGKIVMTF